MFVPHEIAQTGAGGFVVTTTRPVRLVNGSTLPAQSTYVRVLERTECTIQLQVEKDAEICLSHFGPPFVSLSWPVAHPSYGSSVSCIGLRALRHDADMTFGIAECVSSIAVVAHGSTASYPTLACAKWIVGIQLPSGVAGTFSSVLNFGASDETVRRDEDVVRSRNGAVLTVEATAIPSRTVALVSSVCAKDTLVHVRCGPDGGPGDGPGGGPVPMRSYGGFLLFIGCVSLVCVLCVVYAVKSQRMGGRGG